MLSTAYETFLGGYGCRGQPALLFFVEQGKTERGGTGMKLRTVVFAVVLAGSVTMNVATVAFSSVAMLVSGAFEVVTGAASVLGARDRKINNLSDDLVRKEAEVVSLTDEVDTLRTPKSVTYRGQKRLLAEAVEDTAARVSRRTAAGAARNAGSVVAEAIPVAGVAVVLGVTAWDLKDACDTMTDLHELELAFNPSVSPDPEASEVCGLTVPTKDEVWTTVKASPGVAWEVAASYLPDLPEFTVPKIDWSPWN
jgi:hypothetical protein